jgi:hypothetical protein
VAFVFAVRDGKVAQIELVADPDRLSRMNVEVA